MQRPGQGCAFGVVQLERVGQCRRHQTVVGGADQQPCSGLGRSHVWQLPRLPFDSQQPFAHHPGAVAAGREAGAHLQPANRQQDRSVLVQHVEVGFDARACGRGNARVAVAGRVGRVDRAVNL